MWGGSSSFAILWRVPRSAAIAVVGAVALAAAVACVAVAAPANGTYRGKTSQKLAISLTVARGAVTRVNLSARDSCHRRPQPIEIGGTRARIRSDGRFTLAFRHPGTTLKVVGRFTGRRASGTVRETYPNPANPNSACDTGSLRFAVRS
jgi:hypothetical protein